MKYILDPMMVYMLSEIDRASYHWQSATLHENIAADEIGSGKLLGEKWPFVVVAEGKNDSRCMQALARKHEDGELQHFRHAAKTIRMNHLLFKFLSREASWVHSKLIVHHETLQYKLFLLIKDPSKKDEILGTCPVLRGAFVQKFIELHEGEGKQGITGADARMRLSTIAIFARTCTVRLEVLNGYLQRLLRAKSNCVTKPELGVISAEFVLGTIREREKRAVRPSTVKFPQGKKIVDGEVVDVVRRGGGGAWRAFVHQESNGKSHTTDFSLLADAYELLDDERKAALREAGREGTVAHRHGGRAFGLNDRELQRDVQRAQRVHECRVAGLALAIRSEDITTVALLPSTSTDLDARLEVVRAELRSSARRAYDLGLEQGSRLRDWQRRQGISHRDALISVVPRVAPESPGMTALPFGALDSVASWSQPCRDVVPRILGLRRNLEFKSVFEALPVHWEGLHQCTFHDDLPKLLDRKTNYTKKPSCIEAGLCLCGDNGTMIWSIKKWLVASMKKSFAEAFAKTILKMATTLFDFVVELLFQVEMASMATMMRVVPWR